MTARVMMERREEASDTADAPLDGRQLATKSEIRQALSVLGLTPPPLMRYRDRALTNEPEAHKIERDLFRELTRVIGAAAKERESDMLRDIAVKRPDFHDAADEYISPDTDKAQAEALRGLAGFALPVLTRMPARSDEDRDKRRNAADSLLFASTVTPTRALFIVSSENERAVTFRIHHQLIERLQQGCEDLIRMIEKPIVIEAGEVHMIFDGQIEIYEVGQEDSTIMGAIVGTSFSARLKYAARKERAQYWALGVLILLLIILFGFLAVRHFQDSTIADAVIRRNRREFVTRHDAFWTGETQRLQSGLIPVLLVSAITLVIKFPRGVVVRWTQRYGQNTD
jgi:hypothetical protein